MRTGDEQHTPIYWYATGEAFLLPDGTRAAYVDALEACRAERLSATRVRQLSRKLFVFRDLHTAEVITALHGKELRMVWHKYQVLDYELKDGRVHAEVTAGVGDRKTTYSSDRFHWRDCGNEAFSVCVPFFSPRGWAESNVYGSSCGDDASYHVSWHGSGPSPIDPSGKLALEMSGRRFDSFELVPKLMRDYIKAHAPLWAAPPNNMEEVSELQCA